MSSGITFSGVNGIDFSVILNAVMAQASVPLTSLQTQKKTLESQDSLFANLASKLATFQTAADNLSGLTSMASLKATASSTSVGVSTTTGTVPGNYSVVVSELARAQVTASSNTFSGLDAVVGSSGSLTVTPATGDPVTVTLNGATTLKELVAQINDDSDSPVTAAAVQTQTGIYRMVLTSKQTGTDHAFTISGSGSGVVFTDTDGNGIAGDSAADSSQNALNASFTVNNLPITSATNEISDVIPGVTLSLKKKDPTETIAVDVSRDTAAAKDKVKQFITAFNDITTFAKDQNTAAIAGKANIGRDPLVRGLRNEIREAVQETFSGLGDFSSLAEIGLGFDTAGKLILDETLFGNAMASSPGSVQALFSGEDGKGGAFGAVSALVKNYTTTGGLVARARERVGDQVDAMEKRIDDMSARLAIRRESLQREYIAADQAMSQLKSQGSSLSALGSAYSSF